MKQYTINYTYMFRRQIGDDSLCQLVILLGNIELLFSYEVTADEIAGFKDKLFLEHTHSFTRYVDREIFEIRQTLYL